MYKQGKTRRSKMFLHIFVQAPTAAQTEFSDIWQAAEATEESSFYFSLYWLIDKNVFFYR